MDYHTGTEEVDNALDERFKALPPSIKAILNGDAVTNFSNAIQGQFELSEEDRTNIEREIVLILMWLEPVGNFLDNLLSEALIAPDVAGAIVKAAEREVFNPVIQELALSQSEAAEEQPVSPQARLREPNLAQIRPDDFKPTTPQQTPASFIPPSTIPPVPPRESSTIPPMNVMPHTPEEVAQKAVPNPSTELPNALLKNLRASLAHSEAEQPPEEEPARRPSYGTMLNTKPLTQP